MALFETRASRRAHKTDQRDAGINHRKWSQVQHGIRAVTTMDSHSNASDARSFFGIRNSIPEYITLYNKDELYESVLATEPHALIVEIIDALTTSRSAHAQITLMRDLLYRAGTQILLLDGIIDNALLENHRVTENIGERGRKRWTSQDDELLIEMASHDDTTIVDLSQQFGRTPGAIQSRISKLVGIKKMSAEIAGRFIGTLNGEFVEGDIDGTVSKR